jgi:hypothetical protein
LTTLQQYYYYADLWDIWDNGGMYAVPIASIAVFFAISHWDVFVQYGQLLVSNEPSSRFVVL